MKDLKKSLLFLILTASVFIHSLPVLGAESGGKAVFLTPKNVTVEAGSSVQLKFYYGGKVCTPDSCCSSDDGVAAVSSACLVTGLRAGTVTITACFGYESASAVVKVTGTADKSTISRYQEALAENDILFDDISIVSGSYTSKETIQNVQEKLNQLGYNCGTADGICGKKTRASIKAYQTDHDMEATGTIDEELCRSLEQAEPMAIG